MKCIFFLHESLLSTNSPNSFKVTIKKIQKEIDIYLFLFAFFTNIAFMTESEVEQ